MKSPLVTRRGSVAALLVLLVVAGALAAGACGKASSAADASASRESTTTTQGAARVGTLAVVRSPNGTGHQEIYLVRTDGSGLRQLTHTTTGRVGEPAWSPDGARIAYISGGERRGRTYGTGTVWVVNADGSGAHQVDSGGYGQKGSVTAVAWSPDSSQLVLTRAVAAAGDLDVMIADGSDFRVLDKLPAAHYGNPFWSPAGRIFFSTDVNGLSEICSVNPDGSDVTDVTVLPTGWRSSFSFSRDGRWLAIVDGGEGRAVYRAVDGHLGEKVFLETGMLAKLKGEDRLRFAGRLGASWFASAPSWSPDDTSIAFVGGAISPSMGGSHALYIVNVDGSGLRMVPNAAGLHSGVDFVAWQPQ